MTLDQLLNPSAMVASLPPGAVNVLVGKSVEGPGGRWVPCATEVTGGLFLSSLFQVGPGQRQVCLPTEPQPCADVALTRAKELAVTAAA